MKTRTESLASVTITGSIKPRTTLFYNISLLFICDYLGFFFNLASIASLITFLRDDKEFQYTLEEKTEKYIEWVKEDKYIILSKLNKEKWNNAL